MRKNTLSILCLALIGAVSSCFDPSIDQSVPSAGGNRNVRQGNAPRSCATMDVLAENIKANPSLERNLQEIDKQAERFALRTPGASVSYTGVVTIPVRVHVIYDVNRPEQNISDAQIQSQITVLNADFSKTNRDVRQLPSAFSGLASSMQIQFTLAGIDRKSSTQTEWGTRDAMKSSTKGGVDATDPAHNLNIWVCNIGGGILGYAQFPGGKAATDGIVVGPEFFGSSDIVKRGGYFYAPYDKGRTATHEIGHWLNLRHIWGDANCGNDYVADTPTQQTYNFGCPAFPHVTCGNGPNGDLFMNYMDYTDDPCMYMFTNGQTTRSRALFASDGARYSFVAP